MQDSYSGSRFRSALKSFLIGRAAQGLASLLFVVVSVRLLNPRDFGVYMTLWGLLETMVPLSSMGMLEVVRRFLPDIAMRGSRAAVSSFTFRLTLIRAAVLCMWLVLAWIFWPALMGWLGLGTHTAKEALPALGLIVTVLGARFACEMLECLLEQKYSQRIQAGLQLGRLFGLLVLNATDVLNLGNLLLVDLGVSAVCLLLAEISLSLRVKSIRGDGDEKIDWKAVLRFMGNVATANLLQTVGSVGLARAIIARLLGLEAAGAFSFIQQLLTIVNRYMPAQLLANIIRPLLVTRYLQGDQKVLGVGMSLLSKSNLVIVGICVVGLAASGDQLIGLLSGGRFPTLGMVSMVMFCGLLASSQSLVFDMMAQIVDRTAAMLSLSSVFLLLPAAQWIGAQHGGLLGAAAGLLVVRVVIVGLAWPVLIARTESLQINWHRALQIVAAVGLSAVGAYFLRPHLPAFAVSVLAVACYFSLLFMVKPLDSGDVGFVGRLAKGNKSAKVTRLLLAWSR